MAIPMLTMLYLTRNRDGGGGYDPDYYDDWEFILSCLLVLAAAIGSATFGYVWALVF